MKISLIQSDLVWSKPADNIKHFDDIISHNPKSDLYVLPEMWSTGFVTEPMNVAEEDGGKALLWMQETAEKKGAAIAGSIAVLSEETFRNRFYFVKPDGETVFYDKHHLFTYGGEHLLYTPGNRRVTVKWKDVRFLLLVCYDLRFPIWARNHEDYDAILCVASWPVARIEAWHTLLKARAIENQCYVAGVNRIGKDPNCIYCGGTCLVDPQGSEQRCTDNFPTILNSTIDIKKLEQYRKKFPVLEDRDRETILY